MNRDRTEEIQKIADTFQALKAEIQRYVVGNDSLIELVLLAILSEGHVLLEGTPGTAKTTVAKIVSALLDYSFSRFQCSIDTQPPDIVGLRIWDPELKEFIVQKGPIFSDFFLIDEINRLSPKSQSAFIEALSEHQVTIDGVTYPIEPPFFFIATQNPLEYEGTFPLIEAQKDRFAFSVPATHLNGDDELIILRRLHEGKLDWDAYQSSLKHLISKERVIQAQKVVRNVHIEDNVLAYIRDIILATRTHPDIRVGSSTRGSIALLRGAQAVAVISGRDFVTPDDIKKIAVRALSHRIVLTREAEISGITPPALIQSVLDTIEVP